MKTSQKPGPRKIILQVIIAMLLILSSFYQHFNIITAQDVLFPNHLQEPTHRIVGTIKAPQVVGTIILKVNGRTLAFEFPEIQEGIYGIRCFQDLNNNGKLDRGLRGPKEPWYLTWKTKERFPPRFQDISFHLQTDTLIYLHLSK